VRRSPVAAALASLALATAASSSGAVRSQDPQRPPIIIGAEVEIVSVPVMVFDKAGRFVPDLKKEDIQILEDGVRQALVVSFNESVKSSSEFTDDIDRLDSFINGLQVWGGTALYDGVMYSLDRLRNRPGRKALILLSDGDDTASSAAKNQVTALAKSLEVSVYAVGIQGFDTPRGFLKDLAQDTGGLYFFPSKVNELIKVFEAISKDLKNNYLVAYSPSRAADNTYRKIEVRVANRPELTVRVRPGYMAARKRRSRDQ
jgi:Ca-activated chloride channel homolog